MEINYNLKPTLKPQQYSGGKFVNKISSVYCETILLYLAVI